MRKASLIVGMVAGFMGLAWAAFLWLIDSWTSTGVSVAPGAFALVGLVGASLARHRPRACVALESAAGVGLLAGGHIFLGSPFLGAALLALVGLARSQPAERPEARARADAASVFKVVGVGGVAVVAGLLLPFALLMVVVAALSGH
jgi:hypothetical protein